MGIFRMKQAPVFRTEITGQAQVGNLVFLFQQVFEKRRVIDLLKIDFYPRLFRLFLEQHQAFRQVCLTVGKVYR